MAFKYDHAREVREESENLLSDWNNWKENLMVAFSARENATAGNQLQQNLSR